MDDYQQMRDILKETDVILKRHTIKMEELRKSQKETSDQLKETSDQLKETDRIVRQISRDFGGFTTNSSRETEDLFYKAIEKNDMKIGNYQFDYLEPNVIRKRKSKQIEIDLLLVNSIVIGLVEIKSTLHLNDIINHHDKWIPLFRSLFPEYRNIAIIGMVGGRLVNSDAVKAAHDYGFTILTPDGGELVIDDSCQKKIKA